MTYFLSNLTLANSDPYIIRKDKMTVRHFAKRYQMQVVAFCGAFSTSFIYLIV